MHSSRTIEAIGVLAALPGELGQLPESDGKTHAVLGSEIGETEICGFQVFYLASGVGKVHAARAATLLLGQGIQQLLVVGTCGGLSRGLDTGTMVHCTRAFQADLALRDGRQVDADERWLAAWSEVLPGPAGWFLTADRPVLTPWRRIRLARAFRGPCVADMETAAAARVAQAAQVPFAALRAVTDGAGFSTPAAFKKNFTSQAGRAAASLPALLARMHEDQ